MGEVENSETLENIFLRCSNSKFSILHYTQNQKFRVENLGVFCKIHLNNNFVDKIV